MVFANYEKPIAKDKIHKYGIQKLSTAEKPSIEILMKNCKLWLRKNEFEAGAISNSKMFWSVLQKKDSEGYNEVDSVLIENFSTRTFFVWSHDERICNCYYGNERLNIKMNQ